MPKKKKILKTGTKLKDLLTYYKATIIKAVWYCYKGRYSDQWNRTDLWQKCQTYSMEKKKKSSKNGPGTTECPYAKV